MAEIKILKDPIIRKAAINDLKDILRLNHELFLEEDREFDQTQDIKWTLGKKGKKFFRDVIIKKDNFCEVIGNKNKIIGYLNGGMAKKILWRKEARYAYLGSIFIEKKFRQAGLGTQLVENFINWCRKNRVDYLSVTAFAQNNFGIKFYKKFGFKDYDLTLQKKIYNE
ncbi:MAG: GNAT family N-acetyltransferase [bacterium]|nr:GNAT family N-acetyltransferase [bacterium]